MITNISILPNEIIFEIYKYLSNTQIFLSFYGLNQCFDQTLRAHCQHLSLADLPFEQFHWICQEILPKYGKQIRSLFLSDCRSVLEGKFFLKYFSDKMSIIFPNLERIKLDCFTSDQLIRFLQSLNNLIYLHEIEIPGLLTDEPNLLEIVSKSNQNRFNLMKFQASTSKFPSEPCLNIRQLKISLPTLVNLSDLLKVLPFIQYLHITIEEISMLETNYETILPLNYLTNFYLRCFHHFWSINEIESLFRILPVVEYFSLQISTQDNTFLDTEYLSEILPSKLVEFNFSARYFYDTIDEINRESLLKFRFPIICLIDENLQQVFLHTIPYRFPLLKISSPMSKQMSTYRNYQHVEMFYDNHGMTLAEALPIISRCHRVNEISIQLYEKIEQSNPVPLNDLSTYPKLNYLTCLWYSHSSQEFQSLKYLLQMSVNLDKLFIAFENLRSILNDAETCQILAQRIVHLLILRTTPATPNCLTEDYIPYLHRTFIRLRHLQIDVTDGPLIETITLLILKNFEKNIEFISLVVEGKTQSDEMKSNTKQWIINNTHLTSNDKFDAEFVEKTNRFLLWL